MAVANGVQQHSVGSTLQHTGHAAEGTPVGQPDAAAHAVQVRASAQDEAEPLLRQGVCSTGLLLTHPSQTL